MTAMLRRILSSFAIALGFALPASATTFSVDYTDLWYIPAEDGWGINLIQQNATIFATLFVYGSDQTPRWYVASALTGSNSQTFTGQLFQTTGPYFGAAWTGKGPAVAVGTMSLTFGTNNTGTLSYTVNGVTVTKSIQRQTWSGDVLTGNYLGGLVANATGCSNSSNNGGILIFGNSLVVTHNSTTQDLIMRVNFFSSGGVSSTCNFNGTYGQNGKQGSFTGSWGCTIGGSAYNSGSFTMTELTNTQRGINARFQGSDNLGCQYTGNFGGVRDIQ
jgi:hypothetical protein